MSEQIKRPASLEALYPGDALGAVVADLVIEYTASGYQSCDGVSAWVADRLNEDCARGGYRASSDFWAFVKQEVWVAWNRRAEEQRVYWPAVTDVDKLRQAFKALESWNIVTAEDLGGRPRDHMDICRLMAARPCPPVGFCFFSVEETWGAVRGEGLSLAFGSLSGTRGDTVAVGHLVVQVVLAVGLAAEWCGDPEVWIQVPMVWQNRLAILPPYDGSGGGPGSEESKGTDAS